ncbi:restriction endonuclease [Microcoleus sp. S13_C5]|uniref:restriction endonuclease n=1 Tax=Microcoleus sp. S13_C5 TaxID=3055411 RepID=UPI002FD421F3
MNWETYEETVKNIYQVLGASKGVKIECYGNSCKCTGQSEVKHQIDVLTVHTDGIHNYKTSRECKFWNTRINKDIVMKVWAIRQDCNLQKGIIVSKIGFTPDAIKFAKYYDIGLVELRKPLKQDIENRIAEVNINTITLIPNITRFYNIVHEEEDQNHTQFEINTSESYYLFPDGCHKTIIDLIDNWLREIEQAGKLNLVMEEVIPFPNGTYLKTPELSIKVNAVHIKGSLVTGSMEKVEFRWKDRISLIMKDIFEEKMFTVSHSGNIQEVPFFA